MGTSPCFKEKKRSEFNSHYRENYNEKANHHGDLHSVKPFNIPNGTQKQQQQNNHELPESNIIGNTVPKEQENAEEEYEDENDENGEGDECEEGEEYYNEENVKYIKGELIQEGTGVFAGLNTQNGQLLALKLFRLTINDDIERVRQRVETLQGLQHDQIHTILGWDTENDDQTVIIQMPYESGGSISWLLQKFSKFSPQLAAGFMKKILTGLQYLHQNNIFHQNLKSSNVLLDGDANIKISDINILNSYKISFYSSPECFLGKQYTAASDIWSAGCIFMEMLTKQNPWLIQSQDITLEQVKANFIEHKRIFNYKKIITHDSILKILDKIFLFNPEERLTASELLELRFFKDLEYDQQKSEIIITNRTFGRQAKGVFHSQTSQEKGSIRKSLNLKSNQLNNLVRNRDPEISIPFTGGPGADGSNSSMCYQNVYDVISQKIVSFESSIYNQEKNNKKSNQKQHKTNRLVDQGFIRQQQANEERQPESDIIAKLVGPTQPNFLPKPPMSPRTSLHAQQPGEITKLQTERSKYAQSLSYENDVQPQKASVGNESEKNMEMLEKLMAEQFYQFSQPKSQANQQELEDLMMKQFQQSLALNSAEQTPQQSPQAKSQNIPEPQRNEDYYQKMMEQQFLQSSDEGETEEDELKKLEEMIARQFYDREPQTYKIEISKQNSMNQSFKVDEEPQVADEKQQPPRDQQESSPKVEKELNNESLVIASIQKEPFEIVAFDELESSEKKLKIKEVTADFHPVEQFHLTVENMEIQGDFIILS